MHDDVATRVRHVTKQYASAARPLPRCSARRPGFLSARWQEFFSARRQALLRELADIAPPDPLAWSASASISSSRPSPYAHSLEHFPPGCHT